ncbi:MAG: tyrosine-type recombinase/integrase [Lentisphaeraceae bacterium]|nr:tyrosine-type recombinase/integrase [Lentisphaeraceae bacterium]
MSTPEKTATAALSTVELYDSYRNYLQQVKSLCDATIHKSLPYLERLLIGLNIWPDGDFKRQVTGDSISAFFLQYKQSHGRGACVNMSSCARSFLKYCHLYKILDRDFSALIPTARHWQLSYIPKAVSDENIRKLIDSIGVSSPIGLRDKALIILLAVYGVRGAQLRHLRLNDLDWKRQQIHFPAVKGGRAVNQIMTHEAGNSLSAYLLEGRPESRCPEVFLTHLHSVNPLKGASTLSTIISRRLKRAGIQQAVGISYGSHGFRHAFASRLVGNIPFHEISEMLGHRSPSSTFIYSKVAFSMQREAVMPWPQEA